MKLSRLKQIIKEQLQQLQNQKQSLNEDVECPPSIIIDCTNDGVNQIGSSTCVSVLSITVNGECQYPNCCDKTTGMVDPRGGDRAPMGRPMG